MKNPLISVILPIYNSEQYLKEAMNSILNQTFTDFELLAINDASTDSSLKIIKSFANKDKRVIIINNQSNIGLVKNLNIAIGLANGKYIARMDSDDNSDITRFEKQINFMESNPEIGIVGAWISEMGSNKKWHYPLEHDEIYKYLIYGSPFSHPVVMIRRSVFIDHHIRYSEDFKVGQDYELWSRLLKVTKAANLPQELLKWRKHKNQNTQKYRDLNFKNSSMVSGKILDEIYPDDINYKNHINKLFSLPREERINNLKESIECISKMNINCTPQVEKYLYKKISKKLYIYCRKNVHLGIMSFILFYNSKWGNDKNIRIWSQLKFILLGLKYSLQNRTKKNG